MAYAKTSPLQIALQLGIGAGLTGLFYYSFYKKDPVLNPSLAAEAAKPSASEGDQQLKALEAEAQKTTAQVWGIDSKQPGPKDS